jgi:hypothetical protein
MKLSILGKKQRQAFSLPEILVTCAAFGLVGICAWYALNSGTILYAKNTAENLAHDAARTAVNRVLHDIHNAVSIPQLGHIDTRTPGSYTAPDGSWVPSGVSATFYAETGTGPSAGISFQVMGGPGDPNGGPFNVKNDPGNPELIMIESGTTHVPQLGMRLIFPYYNMEDTIVKVTSNGQNHWNIWTQDALETRFKTKKDTFFICYYTTRWTYVVEKGQYVADSQGGFILSGGNYVPYTSGSMQRYRYENGELHLYSSAPPPIGVTWPVVVARNIASPTPFTQSTTQYVGVNLTTEDTHYSNRNFKAVNTLLAGSVPYRAQLCTTR